MSALNEYYRAMIGRWRATFYHVHPNYTRKPWIMSSLEVSPPGVEIVQLNESRNNMWKQNYVTITIKLCLCYVSNLTGVILLTS